MYGTTGWRVAPPLGEALRHQGCQSRIFVTCHSAKIIASSKSKIACILYKFFPPQNKNHWKDPPKIPRMWEPEYISAQLIHSYPVCNFLSFKGEKASLSKGLLSEYWFCTCSGCCWLSQRCTIMGNQDNICPQSQGRTNILSTSKSSLICRGGGAESSAAHM